MERFLIIYEIVPEYTFIYDIETNDEEIIKNLKASHKNYLNDVNSDNDLAAWLSEYLNEHKPIDSSTEDHGKIPVELDEDVYTIILCGELL